MPLEAYVGLGLPTFSMPRLGCLSGSTLVGFGGLSWLHLAAFWMPFEAKFAYLCNVSSWMPFWIDVGDFGKPILATTGCLLEAMLAFDDLTVTYLILPLKS